MLRSTAWNASGDNHAEWLINHVESYKAQFTQPLGRIPDRTVGPHEEPERDFGPQRRGARRKRGRYAFDEGRADVEAAVAVSGNIVDLRILHQAEDVPYRRAFPADVERASFQRGPRRRRERAGAVAVEDLGVRHLPVRYLPANNDVDRNRFLARLRRVSGCDYVFRSRGRRRECQRSEDD